MTENINVNTETITTISYKNITISPNDIRKQISDYYKSITWCDIRQPPGKYDGLFKPVKITNIKLNHVIGMKEAKKHLTEDIIAPLQYPKLAKQYNIPVGGGLLLYGAPGIGKTMIAHAIAGETGLPLIEAKIPEIVDQWLGESEKRIQEIFNRAKENAPCILFFDEIEYLGMARDSINSSTPRAFLGMVNVFLKEIENLRKLKKGVMVIGATNVPWLVDNALKRSGRFDNPIYVRSPNKHERERLFMLNLNGKNLAVGTDFEKLASLTEFCTGADIATICSRANKKAWNKAIKENKTVYIDTEMIISCIKQGKTLPEWYKLAGDAISSTNNKELYTELAEDIEEFNKQQSSSASTSYR